MLGIIREEHEKQLEEVNSTPPERIKSEVHVQPLSASKARVFRENPEHVLSAKVKQHLKTYHIPKTKSGTPSYYRKRGWRDRAEINPDRGRRVDHRRRPRDQKF